MSSNYVVKKEDAQRIFKTFDTDGNNKISQQELKNACAKCGIPIDDDNLADIVAELDLDKSGEIDFPEFWKFIDRVVRNLSVGGDE